MKTARCELLSAGEVLPNPKWRMAPHLHTHDELIVIKSGKMLLKTKHGAMFARCGDMLFYKAGLVHEEISQTQDPVNSLFIAFRNSSGEMEFPLRMQDSEGRVAQLLSWLVQDCRRGRPAGDCSPALQNIIQELNWLQVRPHDSWQEHVHDYMATHLSEPVSLDEVAGIAGMSKFAFVRKFRRLSGRTPMEELRLMRLNEARNLILSSDKPLKSIAPAVGIGDEYQLSKLFRRHFGMSPREMRSRPGRNRVVHEFPDIED